MSNVTSDLVHSGLFDQGWQWARLNPWLTVLALITTNLILTKYRAGLRRVPGPFTASFSNFWKLRAVWNKNMHRQNMRVHEDYGPIVRIGPNHVSVSDPESARVIYGVQTVFRKVSLILSHDNRIRHHAHSFSLRFDWLNKLVGFLPPG